MNFERLVVLRNLARKLGLTKLLTIPQLLKRRKLVAFYQKHKPDRLNIELLGHQYALYTGNAYEWMRANAVSDDQHIIEALLNKAPKGKDIWDIGASIGAYSILLAKHQKDASVISFEPEPASRKKLEANIQLNQLKNIRIMDIALGDQVTSMQMELADQASAGTHKITQQKSDAASETITVEILPANVALEKFQLKVPGAMKIDVEGFEERVLMGASHILKSSDCKAIMIEVHFSIFAAENDNGRTQRIKDLLAASGFSSFEWVDASHLLASK